MEDKQTFYDIGAMTTSINCAYRYCDLGIICEKHGLYYGMFEVKAF